jgi:hypothetical protein
MQFHHQAFVGQIGRGKLPVMQMGKRHAHQMEIGKMVG